MSTTLDSLDAVYNNNDELFICDTCKLAFATKGALSNHVKTHPDFAAQSVVIKVIKRRRRPTIETKLQVLNQLVDYHVKHGSQYPRAEFDKASGYASSSISEWLKQPRVRQVATLPWLTCFKRLRTVVIQSKSKFKLESDILYDRFLYRRRAMGQEVSGEWLQSEMLSIVKEYKGRGWTAFRASDCWLHSFIENYDISHQMQTEKKGMANSLRIPLLQIFHENLCRLQQSMGHNPRHPIYGRFSPLAIWNIDQVPLSFTRAKRKSYNPKNTPCWVVNQGRSGLEKRMATLVLTLRAGGEQVVPPFVLFKGEGKIDRSLLDELDASGIPYLFNEKAWTNEEAAIEHLMYFNGIIKQKCPEFTEHMLLLDQLSSQSTMRFIELALDLNITPVFFPPNCTHLVQPVDHHIAAFMKQCYHTLYMEEEEIMYDDWQFYRENGCMCPQYLRKTLLEWTRYAWHQLLQKPVLLRQAFVSTGCLITLRGEHAIKFQDIYDYHFDFPN